MSGFEEGQVKSDTHCSMTPSFGAEPLLNSVFQVPEGGSFFDDFPVWRVSRAAPMREFSAYEKDALVACVYARIASMKVIGSQPAKIGIIGGVATDSNQRQKGIATQLLLQANEWLESEGVAGVFLWSGEHSFYKKFGFKPYGLQARLRLSSLSFQSASYSSDLTIQHGWTDELLPLLKARPLGLQITDSDKEWIAAHRNVRWYWMSYSHSPKRPVAYAAVGKGIDLQGIVHEWGGEGQALKILLKYLDEFQLAEEVIGPPHRMGWTGKKVEHLPIEYLCLGKVIDSTKLPGEFWFWGLDGA